MTVVKFLIDTNVVIGLEDNQPIKAAFAELERKCSEHGVRIFVHPASYDDVRRDKDSSRQQVTLNKLEKFEQLDPGSSISPEELSAKYGPFRSPNDESDAQLLSAVAINAVDFLVSEDTGVKKRAAAAGLTDSVLSVDEARNWLRQSFEPTDVRLPFIVTKKAYSIDRADPIFESLRADYPGFDEWFEKCAREHRDCWVIELSGEMAGLAIRKDESHSEAGTTNKADKVLKICTFKLKTEFRGDKLGEHLLKQILWFAQDNGYGAVYLTAFPQQEMLINLLYDFGFEKTKKTDEGELFIEKVCVRETTPLPGDQDRLGLAKKIYPCFYDGDQVRKFCVPIRPDYHRKLFPEIARLSSELPLFPESEFDNLLGGTVDGSRTPGNTIRKVYLCRTRIKRVRPGDILLFYMSKDVAYTASQTITTIGVVDRFRIVDTVEELMRVTAKRSVFSRAELDTMIGAKPSPVVVIDFLLNGHYDSGVPLKDLINAGVFSGHPPQSIMEIPHDRYLRMPNRHRFALNN